MSGPVLIMAGGTGGHIFPGLALARALRARSVPVLWLGSQQGLEQTLVPEAGFELRSIAVQGLRGRGAVSLLLAPLRLARALWQAIGVLRAARPRAVVSFGGFAAGPGGLAAWLLRRPLLVHEQNRIPGLTNRTLARLARRVLCGFPGALPKGEAVGNPVRAEIAALAPPAQRFAGRSGPPRLLVLGGSQGARALNAAVPEALARCGVAFEVRHQCGRRLQEAAQAAYAAAGLPVQVEPFIADMAQAYAWADLVLARAGALTLAELAAAGLPAILVPYPHAVDDHQSANARSFVEAGAARMLPESPTLAAELALQLGELGRDAAQRQAMAEAARALARPEAAERLAEIVLQEARA